MIRRQKREAGKVGRAQHMVGVAQLVEHSVVVRDVAGSSPVVHPNFLYFSLLHEITREKQR
jgi:hypothetical protein